jgi:catalase
MGDEEKGRLVANIAGSLSRVSRPEIIERSLDHFRRADKNLGEKLKKAVDSAK